MWELTKAGSKRCASVANASLALAAIGWEPSKQYSNPNSSYVLVDTITEMREHIEQVCEYRPTPRAIIDAIYQRRTTMKPKTNHTHKIVMWRKTPGIRTSIPATVMQGTLTDCQTRMARIKKSYTKNPYELLSLSEEENKNATKRVGHNLEMSVMDHAKESMERNHELLEKLVD